MSPGVKLAVGLAVVVAAIGYLGYLGAASSWQYYLVVDEAVADAPQLAGHRIRVSGRVAAGSLAVADDHSRATFDLAGDQHVLPVSCRGPLPDNLAEGIDVVVEGSLAGASFQGDKVITRCASKYERKGTVVAAQQPVREPAPSRAAAADATPRR